MHLHLQRVALQPVQGRTSSSGRLLAGGNLPQSLYGQARPLQSFPAEVHKLSRVSLSFLSWFFCTNSYTFQGVDRSPKVARDATTNVPGGMERRDGTIIERTQLLLLFLLFWNCFPSLSSLPSIRGAAVSAYLNGSLEFPF